MATPQICIIGAGISGLVLGRCLLHHGVRPILFEKSLPSPNRHRYGITLHSASYQPLLNLLGIEEGSFRSRVAVDAAIGGTGGLLTPDNDSSFRANRSRFEGLMRDGLDIRYGHQFEMLTSKSGLTLGFANGTQYKADSLVGADGVHSRVRNFVAPGTEFKILPYAVYNGKRRISRQDFDSRLKQHFNGGNIVEQQINQTVFQIAVDDYAEDEVSISYIFSRPRKAGQDLLYRPTRSNSESKVIPEAFFDEIGSQCLEEPYQSIFDPIAMRKDRILNWLMRTVQVEHEVLKQAADNGIVLIGEASHAEPILGGSGANEAIEDGMRLAEILVDNKKLSRFYELRFDDWYAGVNASEQQIHQTHSNSKSSL